MTEQVRMASLLREDEVFKAWCRKIPPKGRGEKPWRLLVQREENGPWARKDFAKYSEAFNAMASLLASGVWDAAVSCKETESKPPIVKIRGRRQYLLRIIPEGHRWCPYCRRPTVFRQFARHHNFPKNYAVNAAEERCTICGVRWAFCHDYIRQGG